MTDIVLVAAVARNGVIGRGNQLVFTDPADLRHLRALTMGNPVLMGRKTWESLPARFRPLPGRRNLVISRQPAFVADGAEVATSLDAALALVAGAPQAFVIGGAEIYALALPHARRLVLTEVDADLDGDTRFPAWDRLQFTETSRSPQAGSGGPAFAFVSYERLGTG
jgi:dihydrofolate reductase